MMPTPPSRRQVADKLPREAEHLDALRRMQALVAYYEWTYALARPWLGRRVLDAGCGVGNFVDLVKDDAEFVLAVDLSPLNVAVLRERFGGRANVEILQADLDGDAAAWRERELDTITCLDVLEHVEHDVELLRRFAGILPSGGHVVVKVPACPWLYGSIDEASGHHRRYTPDELASKARQAGLEVVRVGYMNVFGVLPYWFKSRVLRRRRNFSRTFRPWQLALIRRLMPALRRVDGVLGPPIGQSALLIAVKP